MRKMFVIASFLLSISACGTDKRDQGLTPPSGGDGVHAGDTVNLEKIKKVDAHFHLQFIDENSEFLDLTSAEKVFYLKDPPPRRPLVNGSIPDGEMPVFEIGDNPAEAKAPANGQAYINKCEREKVPIPPPWGRLKRDAQSGQPARNGWVKRGRLPANRVFIAPEFQPAEVWDYQTDQGLCMALVRFESDELARERGADTDESSRLTKEIREIGIICQSRITGKACFWAAHDRKRGEHILGDDLVGLHPRDMLDGDHPLTRPVCTECHRGSNVFIWRPGSKLINDAGKEVEYSPDTFHDPDENEPRYMPVATPRISERDGHKGADGQARRVWQNEGQLELDIAECGLCHSFADVTKSWCESVLKPALGQGRDAIVEGRRVKPARTMPINSDHELIESEPGKDWRDDYRNDLQTLTELCQAFDINLMVLR